MKTGIFSPIHHRCFEMTRLSPVSVLLALRLTWSLTVYDHDNCPSGSPCRFTGCLTAEMALKTDFSMDDDTNPGPGASDATHKINEYT